MHRRHHMLQIAWIAPIEPENLRKYPGLFWTADKASVQGPVKIPAAGEPDRRDRLNRIDNPPRPDGQSRPAQSTGKMRDIFRQFRGVGQVEGQLFSHARAKSFRRQGGAGLVKNTGGL